VSQTKESNDIITMSAQTLAGDLRDFILDRLRHDHNPLPWQMRKEAEQKEIVEAVESAVRIWVYRACTLIASGGQQAARGSLVKIAAKDGLQVQINVAASDPLRHELVDHIGAPVLIVIADVEKFTGERSSVKITKDQPDFIEEDE
jgi:hypothetical protein